MPFASFLHRTSPLLRVLLYTAQDRATWWLTWMAPPCSELLARNTYDIEQGLPRTVQELQYKLAEIQAAICHEAGEGPQMTHPAPLSPLAKAMIRSTTAATMRILTR